MRLQWNLLSAPNAAKTFQARVDRVTTERLLAIQRAEGWTDSELVQHALELVIDEADTNLATIIDKADAIRDFFTGKAQTPPQHGGRGSDDEVVLFRAVVHLSAKDCCALVDFAEPGVSP
jgi:hypothetical protein